MSVCSLYHGCICSEYLEPKHAIGIFISMFLTPHIEKSLQSDDIEGHCQLRNQWLEDLDETVEGEMHMGPVSLGHLLHGSLWHSLMLSLVPMMLFSFWTTVPMTFHCSPSIHCSQHHLKQTSH